MATTPENRRYEERRKAAGFVRGPRITAEASEALRELAYTTGLDAWQVVSTLILEAKDRQSIRLARDLRFREAMLDHGFSQAEALAYINRSSESR